MEGAVVEGGASQVAPVANAPRHGREGRACRRLPRAVGAGDSGLGADGGKGVPIAGGAVRGVPTKTPTCCGRGGRSSRRFPRMVGASVGGVDEDSGAGYPVTGGAALSVDGKTDLLRTLAAWVLPAAWRGRRGRRRRACGPKSVV